MKYTLEELKAMTPEQLIVAINELQVQGDADIAQQNDLPAIVNFTAEQLAIMTKEDLLKAKDDFKATAEATILEFEQKITEKEAEVKEEIEKVGTELLTIEQTFTQKYGQATAHGVEIILLVVIAGKLLGVL